MADAENQAIVQMWSTQLTSTVSSLSWSRRRKRTASIPDRGKKIFRGMGNSTSLDIWMFISASKGWLTVQPRPSASTILKGLTVSFLPPTAFGGHCVVIVVVRRRRRLPAALTRGLPGGTQPQSPEAAATMTGGCGSQDALGSDLALVQERSTKAWWRR